MIKVLKIQKGLLLIILGVIAIAAYAIMVVYKMPSSRYVLGFSGFLLILGSLMLLYPIISAKKDRDGVVELDPEKIAIVGKEDDDKEPQKEEEEKA